MEALTADLAQLNTGKKNSMSFMDVVGADIGGSFDRSMQTQIVSDTFHISSGGQDNVAPLSNIQITISDDSAIQYLKRSGILFDLRMVGPYYLHNAAALFSGIEISFGNVQTSTPLQQYLIQQKLTRKPKRELSKFAGGIGLKYQDFGSQFSYRNAGGNLTSYKPILFLHDDNNPSVITASANVNTTEVGLVNRQLAQHMLTRIDRVGDVNTMVQKFFVPFHLIFDCINDLPDDGAIFTGYGQRIKMNIRLNSGQDCMNVWGIDPADGGGLNYRLEKMQLVKCFSKLSQPLADNILKSNIELPLCKYVHWQQQQVTPTMNAIYSVSKDDLITGLIFGFHTRTACAVSGEAANTLASMLSIDAAQYKSPLSYFPAIPVSRIQISVGGELIVYDMQQLQALEFMSDISDDQMTFEHPVLRKLKCAYRIDLRRFAEDLFGSSAKQTTTVQVQINLAEAGQFTMPNQAGGWDATAYGNFSLYSFLETLSFMECRNGVYTTK